MTAPSTKTHPTGLGGVSATELTDMLDTILVGQPDIPDGAPESVGDDDDVLLLGEELDLPLAEAGDDDLNANVVEFDEVKDDSDDDDVLLLDQVVEPADDDEVPTEPTEPDEDVLVLDQEVAPNDDDVPTELPPEPVEPDDEDVLLLDQEVEPNDDDVPTELSPEPVEPDDEDVLLLDQEVEPAATPAPDQPDEEFLAGLPPYEPPPDDDGELVLEPELEPESEPQPEPEPEQKPELPPIAPATGLTAESVTALVESVLTAYLPAGSPDAGKGDATLPRRLDALELLLSNPLPGRDFEALDLLYACWPKATTRSNSRALLAVALHLASQYGLPSKLPMAASKAWRMLDAELFEDELAQMLGLLADFIFNWQREQRHFLMLEFGEVELIEYFFESLDPGRHLDLMAAVMNFKVLSNRRMGLLRRIPNRLKKQIQPMLPANFQQALTLLAHTKALLQKIATPPGFPPIIETAGKAVEEIDKLMKQVAAAGAPKAPPPAGGGGQALGRIG